jgi:hypothetical protein
MEMVEEGKQGGSEEGGSGDQTIKVGEKEYTVADVENLVANTATLTKKGESVQGILDMCARYGMEPEDFLDQATGGLEVISKLIQDGVIDEQGQIKAKDDPLKKKEPDPIVTPPKEPKGPTKAEEIAAKALEGLNPMLKELKEGLDKVTNIQSSMIHDQYRDRILKKHPELDDKDADHVLSLAMNDSKKDLWGHAEDLVTAKVASKEALEKAFAEKHGLDYEALKKADENKLNEQDDKGEGPRKPVGKKIKLNASGKDEVTPFEAAQSFYDKQLGGD